MIYLFVALGGGLGAMLRTFFSQLLPFAFGAMSANITGSFAMGIAFVTIRTKVGSKKALLLLKGILRGFPHSPLFRWTHSGCRRRVKWDWRLAMSHLALLFLY